MEGDAGLPNGLLNGDAELHEPLLQAVQEGGTEGAEGRRSPCDTVLDQRHTHSSSFKHTVAALLSLQLGWGLWLYPSAYSKLGWLPAIACQLLLTVLTAYSGAMFKRLYLAVPDSVIFGDIGAACAGAPGRRTVYAIIYTLDATRCIILHLAATQSLAHVFAAGSAPPLWQCGLIVAVPALALMQVRALSNLSGVFVAGTSSQLVALGIVIWKLLASPDPAAETKLVQHGEPWTAQMVSVLNMVFSFGGQFAYVEIIAAMQKPRSFTRAISLCTSIMTLLYGGLAFAGYWSRGAGVSEIVIFSLGDDVLSRLAAACILVQAISQYLVNLNVWVHNMLVLLGRRFQWRRAARARCSYEHSRPAWAAASVFVVGYSFAVSMTVPYFSSLVGIVAGGTYLICAYALPAWFMLKLVKLQGSPLPRWEVALCHLMIPVAVVASVFGLGASLVEIAAQIRAGGRSGWGPEG